jgi:opacity protein-like surface antigen
MKKSVFLLLISGAMLIHFDGKCQEASAHVSGQGPAVIQDNVMISVGYGFPNVVGSFFKQLEDELNEKTTSFGPAYAKFEYIISPKNGIGLNVAYASHKSEYTDIGSTYDINTGTYTDVSYDAKVERVTYSFLLRYNYHFSNSEKMDAFFGVGMGYRYAKWKQTSDNPDAFLNLDIPNFFPFGFETTIGMRYFATKNLGIYAEAGWAKSPIQFGLTLKL